MVQNKSDAAKEDVLATPGLEECAGGMEQEVEPL